METLDYSITLGQAVQNYDDMVRRAGIMAMNPKYHINVQEEEEKAVAALADEAMRCGIASTSDVWDWYDEDGMTPDEISYRLMVIENQREGI